MNRGTLIKLAMVLLGVAWLFVVTLAYYIVHKPFTVENALALASVLGDVSVAGAVFVRAARVQILMSVS